MTVTVGLPVYNAMPFLPQTIDSLFTQVDSDFSLLVIDDGSTDGSGDYLESLSDSRIRLIRRENRGLTATLNEMLSECTTPWLIRHDADDIAYPNKVSILRSSIARNQDAGMIFTNARYHQESGSFGQFRTTQAGPGVLRDITRQGYLLSICHPTVALNVGHVLGVGGYRFNLHVEDIDLWWRMALAHDVVYLDDVTVGFRLNQKSVSSSNLTNQAINTLYVQYLLLSELWSRNPRPIEEVRPTLKTMVRESELRFRECIRQANIHMGSRDLRNFMLFALRAFAASPADFLRRLRYELRPSDEAAHSGIDPKNFARLSDSLWGTS